MSDDTYLYCWTECWKDLLYTLHHSRSFLCLILLILSCHQSSVFIYLVWYWHLTPAPIRSDLFNVSYSSDVILNQIIFMKCDLHKCKMICHRPHFLDCGLSCSWNLPYHLFLFPESESSRDREVSQTWLIATLIVVLQLNINQPTNKKKWRKHQSLTNPALFVFAQPPPYDDIM